MAKYEIRPILIGCVRGKAGGGGGGGGVALKYRPSYLTVSLSNDVKLLSRIVFPWQIRVTIRLVEP